MSKIVLPEYKCIKNDFFSAKYENFEINVLKIVLIEARRDEVANLISRSRPSLGSIFTVIYRVSKHVWNMQNIMF